MKLSETTEEVIRLAEQVHRYWSQELPKRHPKYPLVQPGEDDGPPPPEENRLRELLANLSADQLYQLALIMYLGRGDFEPADIAKQYGSVRTRFGEPKWAAMQLMGKASLADFLREGLDKLRDSRLDVDHLPLAS